MNLLGGNKDDSILAYSVLFIANPEKGFAFQDDEYLFHLIMDMSLGHTAWFHLTMPKSKMAGASRLVNQLSVCSFSVMRRRESWYLLKLVCFEYILHLIDLLNY